MLGSTGSTEAGNPDDGIRTGWVCVNVGVIAETESVSEEAMAAVGFVGFGGQSEGVKLVVQMLTEEKREELDLESLWRGFLRRQQRKEEREAEKSRVEEEEEVGSSIQAAKIPAADISLRRASGRNPPRLNLLHQTRGVHSNTKNKVEEVLEIRLLTLENPE